MDLLEQLREIRATPWKPLERAGLIGFGVGFGLLLLAIWRFQDGWIPILDHANLAFHEAGHVFFGLFGRTMNLYGGTLGQFVFPGIAMVIFWTRRDTVPFAACWVWLFQNMLYVAAYMADARALHLPLLGGGKHDWRTIFLRWGALQHDTTVAAVTKTIAWIGMLAAVAWIGWRFYRSHQARNAEQGTA